MEYEGLGSPALQQRNMCCPHTEFSVMSISRPILCLEEEGGGTGGRVGEASFSGCFHLSLHLPSISAALKVELF